jgi:hypothetical protein
MSPRIAEHMTRHQSHDAIDGVMVYPSDGETWKHFNSVHPHFSAKSRNVHLGLCIDGFNPFGSFAAHSYWLVILTVAMSRSHKLITLASNTTHKIV